MDDSCAVCAESLEWVAYGACGHRDVCSTCVARLRFVCDDRRCCICKSESDAVFVTKAMGDYTRVISDFSVLPSQAREGRIGPYWYHEGLQAFFDDADHCKMIKAMCRLSCTLCDKLDEGHPTNGPKRQPKFRNIDQLKGHLFHRHKLFMCSLCLEGRKIFICEQKLYTRAQLNQHISTGDSEVDGSEGDRGGFAGHPRCEFCRTPFYGDNELYSHMSTEHYTCHICQRQHPGQYEYYKNYDDLEIHFRRDHFLCEDEACLEKKFIVFQSEAEIKRHNTMEHGGRMSRSKRSAALQIPTSFRYRRSNEQDRHRGRRQTFQPDFSDDQLSIAIQASLETANVDGTAHDPAAPPSSSGTHIAGGDAESIDTLIQPFDSLATSNTESSARYLQALGHSSRKAPMEESSFPPLPLASSSSLQKSYHDSEGYPSDSMAARLRLKNKVTIVNASRALPTTSNGPAMPASNSAHSWPTPSTASRIACTGPSGGPSNPAQFVAEAAAAYRPSNGPSRILGNSRINHSASSPNIASTGSLKVSMSDFPPVAAAQMRKAASSQSLPVVEDVQTANKSLVEKIRDALGYDEDKYSTFKVISADYRQGSIDTQSYLGYVRQFGLWHLVLDLARLCPDSRKQKELVDIYNASLGSNLVQQNGCGRDSEQLRSNPQSRKGKGKMVNVKENNSKDPLADSIISTVRKLQSSYNPAEEKVEELSKDGYRAAKGKSKVSEKQQVELASGNPLLAKPSDRNAISSASSGSNKSSRAGGGSSKQQKKTSKFHRIRLGDGSAAAFLDLKNSNARSASDDLDETQVGDKAPTGGGLPVRGAWRTGGSHKLFS